MDDLVERWAQMQEYSSSIERANAASRKANLDKKSAELDIQQAELQRQRASALDENVNGELGKRLAELIQLQRETVTELRLIRKLL